MIIQYTKMVLSWWIWSTCGEICKMFFALAPPLLASVLTWVLQCCPVVRWKKGEGGCPWRSQMHYHCPTDPAIRRLAHLWCVYNAGAGAFHPENLRANSAIRSAVFRTFSDLETLLDDVEREGFYLHRKGFDSLEHNKKLSIASGNICKSSNLWQSPYFYDW